MLRIFHSQVVNYWRFLLPDCFNSRWGDWFDYPNLKGRRRIVGWSFFTAFDAPFGNWYVFSHEFCNLVLVQNQWKCIIRTSIAVSKRWHFTTALSNISKRAQIWQYIFCHADSSSIEHISNFLCFSTVCPVLCVVLTDAFGRFWKYLVLRLPTRTFLLSGSTGLFENIGQLDRFSVSYSMTTSVHGSVAWPLPLFWWWCPMK